MSYDKVWANNEKLNATEKKKLEKDGLEIFKAIPYYAENGFDSIPKEEWDSFKWAGLYLQRPKEAGYFMMRVNIPSGILTNEQVEVLASIAEDYGRDVLDITTRQAIQFHWLEIGQIPDIFNRLEKVGLSSAGACGDITRNIIGNPLAGIDGDELFDTAPIVKEVYDFFQHNEEFSNLPRKFKMSISTNVYNAANAEINCAAFIPATKEIDGKTVEGFHLRVGGGLSARPYLAQELDLFILPGQVKTVAIAIATVFRDFGYREKRHLARLKFLVADWGPEKFKEKLLEYTGHLHDKGKGALKGWNAGYFYGVHKQKQGDLSYVGFNVPVGRLRSEEFFEIARIAKQYGNGEIRTCNSQNLIIPNVPKGNVEGLLKEPLFESISASPKSFIGYAVSCTGIEYCNLALVETKERLRNIADYLDTQFALDVPVRIHMVGCPNSCGQRQIADIGLQGVKLKTKEKGIVEAFEIYVGGTLLDGGVYNQKLKGKIDGEDLPNVLVSFLTYFKEHKLPAETFYEFVGRVGIEDLQGALNHILEEVIAS
ncbi:ferredoxin--nitrite reductase [Bacillus pseudomycoides]|uniref:nitrite/sulfite reductase n=1 Tax=Bacillus TaxID=1386 RepID=UPI000BEDBD3F|nr:MULTISPECIES: ferredoxin--nitrite reductase [Bacillus]MCX2826424.1 nitrite/sulfite reductase [Bacillus sp. DHT2]MDR4914269.1 nitrite/sulfite reductase [Bacillus pseudomycoides]PDX99700.1 ferredoxin--nitrite reductase [Bacillus pseudomycoides]PEK82339.1 ferredoxin--nitrite reductase [Bacillus pseudomycoides]PEN10014.1 ferredoxin--nitrite reductase [Bacillus pseudomycoides]